MSAVPRALPERSALASLALVLAVACATDPVGATKVDTAPPELETTSTPTLPCGPEAPVVTGVSARLDGPEGPLVLTTIVTADDGALHALDLELWADATPDDTVDVDRAPDWTAALDLLDSDTVDAEVCATPGGFPILVWITLDELPADPVEVALQAIDADGDPSEAVHTPICPPGVDCGAPR